MKVGVIGLGTMGMGAALNLLKKGHAVTGCELREETRAAFAKAGGAVVASPDALPADLEAVVVFVVNAAQTEPCCSATRAAFRGCKRAASSSAARPSPPRPPERLASGSRRLGSSCWTALSPAVPSARMRAR